MPVRGDKLEMCELPFPEEGLWMHSKYGTFHRGSERPGCLKTKCGRMGTTDSQMVEMFEWPKFSWPRCGICFVR